MQMRDHRIAFGYDIPTCRKWFGGSEIDFRITCAMGTGKAMRTGESSRKIVWGHKLENAYLEDKFLLAILNFVIHFETLNCSSKQRKYSIISYSPHHEYIGHVYYLEKRDIKYYNATLPPTACQLSQEFRVKAYFSEILISHFSLCFLSRIQAGQRLRRCASGDAAVGVYEVQAA